MLTENRFGGWNQVIIEMYYLDIWMLQIPSKGNSIKGTGLKHVFYPSHEFTYLTSINKY